jgi:5-methylcytosine-specific restriction endonuclease McrA
MPKGIYNRKSEETERLKKRMKENNPTKNPKVREAIKNSHLGKKQTKIHKENISNSVKKHLPKTTFTKGQIPWNYIDGRSKEISWNRYGPDWRRIRQIVLIRDNFTCQNPNCPYCYNLTGIKRLEVHHKIPFILSRDNSLINLITYCPKFHKIEEARIMRELKKQGVEFCLT